jgi:hypothetical protein
MRLVDTSNWRPTSATTAPGANAAARIVARSAGLHRLRRSGPVNKVTWVMLCSYARS